MRRNYQKLNPPNVPIRAWSNTRKIRWYYGGPIVRVADYNQNAGIRRCGRCGSVYDVNQEAQVKLDPTKLPFYNQWVKRFGMPWVKRHMYSIKLRGTWPVYSTVCPKCRASRLARFSTHTHQQHKRRERRGSGGRMPTRR